jgi:hypothetical protein
MNADAMMAVPEMMAPEIGSGFQTPATAAIAGAQSSKHKPNGVSNLAKN